MASWASRLRSRFLLPPGGEGGSGTGPGVVTERLLVPPVDPLELCNRGESCCLIEMDPDQLDSASKVYIFVQDKKKLDCDVTLFFPALGSRTKTGLSYFNKENETPTKRSDIFLGLNICWFSETGMFLPARQMIVELLFSFSKEKLSRYNSNRYYRSNIALGLLRNRTPYTTHYCPVSDIGWNIDYEITTESTDHFYYQLKVKK